MTSTKALEFLTKQLIVQKETVTFRWLSRALSVHVNVAKDELASFYASSRTANEPVYATYLLTGDVAPINAAGNYANNGNEDEMDVEDDAPETVATSKIILVGEDDLEAAKAQFIQAPSIHIYCLSASAVRDAALLAPMTDRVRADDVSKGRSYNETVGIVVGSDVKIGHTRKPYTSKQGKRISTTPSLKPSSSAAAKAAEKPKGTLESNIESKKESETRSFATKKTKEVVKKESKSSVKRESEHSKLDMKGKGKGETISSSVNHKQVVASDKSKRGIKRPSAVMSLSETEDDNPSSKTKTRTSVSPSPSKPPSKTNDVKVKNGALLSDDEDNSIKPRLTSAKQKGKGRARVVDEEDEMDPSLRAMMDVDDPVPASRDRLSRSEHQTDEEDMERQSDPEPVYEKPKTKRKPKKVVPVGRNGFAKRRVIKTRKSKNAKGYTITEDYSSYESVSESEQVQAPSAAKKLTKGRKKPKDDMESDHSESSTFIETAKAKNNGQSAKTNGKASSESTQGPTARGGTKSALGPKGGNLMNYFTKK